MVMIETVSLDSAASFVDLLMPNNPAWEGAPWIFRGHGDSRYDLLPSMERWDHGMERFAWEPYLLSSVRARLEQVYEGKSYIPFAEAAETHTTIDFTQRLVRAGLQAWGSERFVRDVMVPAGHDTEAFYRMQSNESAYGRLPLVAMAQHYGLPTRLLDWSRNALVAAYFAVNERLSDAGSEVCVWAFNTDAIINFAGVDLVSLPAFGYNNMLSQEGLFTRVNSQWVVSTDNSDNQHLDKAVAAHWNAKPTVSTAFRKLLLPGSQAAKCWLLLHQLRVSAYRLFPGHSGVVQTQKERLAAIAALGHGVPD
ncbi:MAG: FRG domain-containing protein [Myxococcota bacterium]